MPLLKPQISTALREAGLTGNSENEEDIKTSLDSAGLSVAETLGQLEFEMKNGDTSAARIRAAELGLRVRGTLKEAAVALPVINIVINDLNPQSIRGVNPILLPREIES